MDTGTSDYIRSDYSGKFVWIERIIFNIRLILILPSTYVWRLVIYIIVSSVGLSSSMLDASETVSDSYGFIGGSG